MLIGIELGFYVIKVNHGFLVANLGEFTLGYIPYGLGGDAAEAAVIVVAYLNAHTVAINLYFCAMLAEIIK